MMSLKKISFAVMFSVLALTQTVGAATIVPVPSPVPATVTSPDGPVSGEFQGMVTSVTQGFVSINNDVLQVTGDAVITYNGGLTSLAVGQIVNYSYATDVDGVKIATTIDAYPTQTTSGTARVYGLGVNNATGGVQLYLGYGGAWATYTGPAVEYFQPYAFISGIGTNTSFGVQLVNYVGFINPTTGRILATSGYMSDIPVTFKPTLPEAVVGQVYNQYTMELGIYGAGDVYMVTAAGLPAGLTMATNGVISGTPTTPGTYVVSLTAMCGQHCVAPYTSVGQGTVTIVVTPDVVAPPVVTSCSGVDQIITNAANARAAILEIGGGPSNGGIAIQIAQNSTTIVPPLTASTFFAAGNLISFEGTMSAANLCVATGATISAPVVVTPADTAAPVITMNGTDATLVAGTSYVDAGATCADDVDATCTVTTTSTVDTTVAGTYTVTYGATDVAGNIATPVVRTVTVTPVTPVVVTTTGSGIVTSVGRDFLVINGGLTAGDHVFYTPTPAGTSFFGGVTTFATGEYVTFTGDVDALGAVHATSMSVYPAVAFVTTLANAQATVAYTATNLMVSGMAPFDVIAFGLPVGMTVDASGVLSGTPTTAGTYSVTLFATDSIGNVDTTVVTLVVDAAPVVADTTAPVITMTGTDVTLTAGTSYVDAGATCTDNVDAACTVTTTSTVDTTTAGTYTVTYGATDVAGNIATSVVRVVIVNPIAVTFVSALASAQATVAYTAKNLLATGVAPFAVTATGVPAGMTVSATGVLSGTPTTAGTYTITLSATDAKGTVGTASRSLTVTSAPVTTGYVSTGKTVEATKQVITAVSATSVTVGTTIIRITPTTVLGLNKGKPLAVGNKIEYKGVLNTDGSVTATIVKIQ